MDTYNMIDFNKKKGFICDMDGVIYHGNRVLPGVAERRREGVPLPDEQQRLYAARTAPEA